MQSTEDLSAVARKLGFDPNYLQSFEDKLFIHGPKATRRLTNFFVLLLLATVIATFGVLSNSTATVIGAMIVAPLMGPIMATAAAVVMGSAPRALRSLALVAVGVTAVILLSMGLMLLVPATAISFSDNGEITSRISPGLLALLTALASGAAGAFITAREEISDSMGGVAIAISLVPPLCVVGIALHAGKWGAAGGAFMLFLTNFLAILLAGGITFSLMGLGRLAITGETQRMRRNAFVLIAAATMLIAIPLSFTSYNAIQSALETQAAKAAADNWVAGTAQTVLLTEVKNNDVYVTVEGSGEAPPLRALVGNLVTALKRPIRVTLRTIPSQTLDSGASAP